MARYYSTNTGEFDIKTSDDKVHTKSFCITKYSHVLSLVIILIHIRSMVGISTMLTGALVVNRK